MHATDDPMPTPTGHQRTTGGTFHWEPPTAEELQAQMPGYTIEKLLGRGGMGAVYKGVQTNLDRPVAIKILPPGVEREDPSFAERFKNEAKLMAKLNHPGVVAVHDFGTTLGGQLYFAMEFVDGTDVSQMIRSQGKLPPDHALAITAHVCDALAAAHELGIVHRDIKPANVLINMKGQVKVADFGLAKVEEPGTHGLTKTGYAMGTPDFVAPEVLMLGSHIDGRADLYAVGVMLYQMLTGEIPRGAFKPATARLPGLDPRFDPIIVKAMQTDREERYQSSAELRRDLDVILTVPFVRQEEPPAAAIPAAQVAQTPAQGSAVAQKPVAKGPQPRNDGSAGVPSGAAQPARSSTPGGAAATKNAADKSVRGTSQPAKSKTPLFIGLGAAAAIGIGAFVMMGGGEKAKQRGSLSGTNGPSTSENPKAVAAAQTTASKNAPSQGSPGATTKTSAPPPATAPVQSVSKWQRVEPTEARWKQLGLEVKDGWVSLLASTSDLDKAWSISSEIKEKIPRDVALRIRFRKVKGNYICLNSRYSPTKPYPEAILWSDGRFQLRNRNTPLGAAVDLEEFKLSTHPTVGEEGILELAVIGSRVIARLNSTTVLEREVAGMSPAGPFEVRSQGYWIKDAEYMNLDNLADPLKELGWNVPAASPGSTSSTVASSASSNGTASPSPPKSAVQAPQWLQEARKRGGKLRFFATGNSLPLIEKGDTEKFDDFVEVSVTHSGWFARRADGNTHAIAWLNTTWPDGKAFPPFSSVAMVRGPSPRLRDVGNATFRLLLQGKLEVYAESSPDIHFEGSMEGHVVYLGRDGTVLRERSTQTDVTKPPADFFKNYSLLSITKDHYVVARAGVPPQSWNIRLGALDQYPAAISGVVDMDSSRDHVISLTLDGRVHVTSGDGKALPTGFKDLNPPPGLPPAIAVRAGSFMSAAQMTDGTWVGWGRSSELIEQIKKLGAVVDLDLHFATKGFMLWIDASSSPSTSVATTAPAAPAPDRALASTPPPAATPSPVPASSPPPATPASELDQRLAALESSFQAAVERDANAAFKASMAALDKSYLGALDRALATATSGGKLEEALALREEKQRIEKGEGVPSEVDESTLAPGKVPDTLKTLRKTYRSTTAQHEATKAKAMQPLYDKYDQALAAVQTELTQAQKLDDALRVKAVREEIAATRGSGEGSAGTPARSASTVGAAATMNAADKSVRSPLIVGTFTNSLGMKFVPVPETDILMCIHETRRQDYAAYADETPGVDASWKNQAKDGIPCGHEDNHPVVGVNWEDAQAFCRWLSKKDGKNFRLATDREWSIAVGIGRKEKWARDTTPKSLHNQAPDFPWDGSYPPKSKDLAGNYADITWHEKFPDQIYIDHYTDGFPTTAPVMSFKPNKLGLYDMGGNVSEWVEDWFDAEQKMRTARDGGFMRGAETALRSSSRNPQPPQNRNNHFYGFRVVMETRAPASPSGAAAKPTTPAPTPPATAAKSDFTNSLGMKFVKVPGTKVLFCIHETRKGDYAKYAAEVPGVDDKWQNVLDNGIPVSDADDHPVVMIGYEDTKRFCAWLSKKESRSYRLPTDREWSVAVGIGRDEKPDSVPAAVSGVLKDEYPWGRKWPPPTKAGNLADTSYMEKFPAKSFIEGYTDGYATTAPVMCFEPNKLGIYDLGGNVREWCDTLFFRAEENKTELVIRGPGWNCPRINEALSSYRTGWGAPGYDKIIGFRIVLETTDK